MCVYNEPHPKLLDVHTPSTTTNGGRAATEVLTSAVLLRYIGTFIDGQVPYLIGYWNKLHSDEKWKWHRWNDIPSEFRTPWRDLYTCRGKLAQLVVQFGSLNLLQQLFALSKSPRYQKKKRFEFAHVLHYAIEFQRMDMLPWIHANIAFKEENKDDAEIDANIGTNMMNLAIQNGNLEILEWLFANRPDIRKEVMLQSTKCRIGELEYNVVKWLHSHFPQAFTHETMDTAARYGRLDIVKFLNENGKEGCSTEAMDSAAGNGHLAVVQFLHENRQEGCTSKALDSACAYGFLDIVRFLHKHRQERPTSAAMDEAAANGHFEIVQFLHQNRQEDCSHRAMDMAAANGHLDIVKFLHHHRQEGCTYQAMNGAARNRHYKVVEFLLANRQSQCCIEDSLIIAAGNGDQNLVELLLLHADIQEWTFFRALDAAVRNGHLTVVEKLYNLLKTFESPIWRDHIVRTASEYGHHQIIQFIACQGEKNQVDLSKVVRIIALNGHLNAVRQIVEEDKALNIIALIAAAEAGHIKLVQDAFKKCVKRTWCKDITAVLAPAISKNQIEIVDFLCKHRGYKRKHDAYKDNKDLEAALTQAAERGYLTVIKRLWKAFGGLPAEKALLAAVEHNHLDVVAFLIENSNDGCLVEARNLAIQQSDSEEIVYILTDAIPKGVKYCTRDNHKQGVEERPCQKQKLQVEKQVHKCQKTRK